MIIITGYENLYVAKTLGSFAFWRKGQKLFTGDKPSKALEILIYLLFNNSKLVSQAELQEALWPDQPENLSSGVLNYNIHVLRKTLDNTQAGPKHSLIKYQHGCYGINDNQDISISVDARQFETYMTDALSEFRCGCPASAIVLYREGLNLYKGDFLPELSFADWVIPVRQHFQNLYITSIYNLIDLLNAEQRHEEIIDVCETAFINEPLDEEMHASYIEALNECGHKQQARNHYSYITKTIYDELNLTPSRRLQRLYSNIKSASHQQELTFSELHRLIKQKPDLHSAGSFDPYLFSTLVKLEKRRLEDEQERKLGLLSLTLSGKTFRPPAAKIITGSMAYVRKILIKNLELEEFYTRWSKTQFVVILNAQNEEKVISKIKSIEADFKANNPYPELVLRSSHLIY